MLVSRKRHQRYFLGSDLHNRFLALNKTPSSMEEEIKARNICSVKNGA